MSQIKDTEYTANLKSSYDWLLWSSVEVKCFKYSTFKRICEAIQPILDDEIIEMKKMRDSDE